MHAILLAAGRGSRLRGLTADKPKCLNRVASHPLLEWQLKALRDAGIKEIVAVTGYCREMIEAYNITTVHNSDWDSTNMVYSLYCALRDSTGPVIISYADILYDAEAVRTLCQGAGEDFTILYDRNWRSLWEERSANPLSDAESFTINKSGIVSDLGQRVRSMDEPQGQYIGLLYFSDKAVEFFCKFATANKEKIRSLDMTSLLRQFIESGREIKGVAVDGNWCEVDTESDLILAEQMLKTGRLQLGTITP